MFTLIYKNIEYTELDIKNLQVDKLTESILKETITFCQKWLHGVQEFNLYTSGSTGKPKKITVSRTQMERSAHNTCQFLGLHKDDIALVSLNPTFIGGKMMLVRALLYKMTAILSSPTIEEITSTMQEHSCSFYAFVPLQLEGIIHTGLSGLMKNAKAILLGGAPMSKTLEQKTQLHNLPVYQTFGMTETVSHFALKNIRESTNYRVLPNIQIRTDERDCLVVKGAVTNNQWITTNDRVALIDNNHFQWMGRVDNTINTGGIKIQIEAVEEVIEKVLNDSLESIPEFTVVGMPDDQLGERITLAIVGEPLDDRILGGLKEEIKASLGKYANPKEVVFVDKLPKTPTQKVDRKEVMNLIQNIL